MFHKKTAPQKNTWAELFPPGFWVWVLVDGILEFLETIKAEIVGNKPLLRAVRFWTFMVVELTKESIPAPKMAAKW